MNLHNLFCRSQKRKVFTRADSSESDLIQYSVDHLEAAKKLYELSDRWTWQYLHSAGFLSHLSVELLLKACLLHFNQEFPAEHDLKRLSRPLRKKGIQLSPQSRKWLSHLNCFNSLRYPDPGTAPDITVNDWHHTKSLSEELRTQAPAEIRTHIISHERYRSNVKSGKAIWS
jgi:HEPN domain-containing protein